MAARAFKGFPKEGITFLKRLKKNNEREWFQPRKDDYEQLVKQPMLDLLTDLGERLRKTEPALRIGPKCIYRVYRDIRFSNDKTPYKTHIAAGFDFQSRKMVSTPGFYISIAPDEIYVGGGLYMPDSRQLTKLRWAIDQKPDPLLEIVDAPKFKRMFGGLKGDKLKKAPKGYLPEHENIELLKHKQFYAFKEFEPSSCLKPAFAKSVGDTIEGMMPLVRWLRDNSV